jgi:signal transduction histidine kinase
MEDAVAQPSDVDLARLLLELSREVTSNLNLQDVLDAGLVALRKLLDFGGGAIQLIEDDCLVAAATDPPATAEARTVRIPVGQGVSGTIAADGNPIYIADIEVDERVFPDGRKHGVSSGVHSYFGVPLITGGRVIGVVSFDAPTVDAFSSADRSLVLAFVPTIAAAVQNAQLFEREVATLNNLREAQRMRDDFLAVISHELRTPLTSIAGFASTLSSHIDRLPSATVVDVAGRILMNSHRLELLIDDLLDLTQLEQGRLTVKTSPTNVAALLAATARETDSPDHVLTFAVDDGLPLAVADERRLRQILANLIGNARKFSPPGGTIEVSASAIGGGAVELQVTDVGKGIPAHLHERIFEPFFQVEPATTRGVGGLGVGLYLVRQLCDMMGATLDVESELGRGSTFTVRLAEVTGINLSV